MKKSGSVNIPTIVAERHQLSSIFRLGQLLSGLFLLCYYGIACADLTLYLDKNKVQQGETFTLTLKIEGKQINAMPDFMPLQKDFSIEGTQSSVNYTVVNGQVRSTSEWTLILSAKRSGILTIPALEVGQEKTAPTTVKISEEAPAPTIPQSISEPDTLKPDAANQQQQDVQLLTDISDTNPFVNQQIIYTVKLYNSSRLLDASYQPPQVEDALFVPMGNGRRYQVNENGRIYSVEEQQFALFPQKSGYLKIKPPTFNALLYDITPKRISVQAKPTTLNVRPIPQDFKGKNWLPAKQVSLSENYDKSAATLAEGSTLVRTVALQAVAVPAQLLPVLDFGSSDQFSAYPEKPVESNQFKQQDLVGRSTIKVTYLLNKAGRVTIPPLTLPWFNTITGKEELSSLPEFSIEVTASAKSKLNEPTAAPVHKPSPSQPAAIPKALSAPAVTPQTHLAWWLAIGFALAWLLTLAGWGWQRKRPVLEGQSKAQILNELKQACLSNQAEEARSALLKWGRLLKPEATVLNLFDLEHLIEDSVLKQQINHLAQFLYNHAKTAQKWQGSALWDAIVNFIPANSGKSAKVNPLPPLNRI
ncbi:MAG: protein BatD [Tatlockia sp.]|nr:protein BatD [Tatlockia sp.]